MLFTNRRQLIASFPDCKTIAEIGVYRGEFSQHIIRLCKPDRLVLVDPWAWTDRVNKPMKRDKTKPLGQEVYEYVVTLFASDKRVEIHRKPSVEAAPTFADGSFDMVYIDGNHKYASVVNDIREWLPKVKPGGVLAGHDYRFPGVRQAVHEFCDAHPQYKVRCTAQQHSSWWFTKE